MKNIFKKNQIIITALCIMIAIAGYLSFTNNDDPEDSLQTANPDMEDFQEFTELEGMEVVTDTTDETDITDDTTLDDVTDEITDDTEAADDTDVTEDDTDVEATDDEEDAAPADTEDDESEELGDASEDDILQASKGVADNGELESDDGSVPGEAVLASTTLDAGFFISSKIEREQLRAQSKENFMDILESAGATKEQKDLATQGILDLNEIAKKENAAEKLLEAKGFEGALVTILDGEVDVVINAQNITEQQLAIIEDVVKNKTDVEAKNIHINPVVVAE